MNNNSNITFSIATNFDPRLIEEIAKINTKHEITTVYGKLQQDILGGGRASIAIPKVSMKELENHIDLCHKHQLRFNYLLNPFCMDNRDLMPMSHKKILRFIAALKDKGIDWITVTSPFLCEVIKRQYPDLKVSISVFNNITTLQRLKYWIDMGAQEVTLYYDVNRDFAKLESFLNYTKNTGTILRLIANNICLRNCPIHNYHAGVQAHASQQGHPSSGFNLEYGLLYCKNMKIRNPVKLIASEWIRPEDIVFYEKICQKAGNYNLSFKLVDRVKTTDFLIGVAKAYLARRYDGNLLDIIFWLHPEDLPRYFKLDKKINALKARYNIREMIKLSEVFTLPEITVDNRKLDGFVEKFVVKYDCLNLLCDDEGWRDHGEHSSSPSDNHCGYCRQWAEKAITLNKDEVARWTIQSNRFLENVWASKPFNLF